jgi:DHA1 family bicyclomycin/chloramphenicol resistance-like MFS transporter
VLTLAAALGFVLAASALKETRLPEHRTESSWGGVFASYKKLLLDPEFIGLTLVGALGVAAFFVYLGNASYVLINHYGLTPQAFSLCFALNAASFFGFCQLTGFLSQRFGLPKVIRLAVTGFAAAMTALGVLTLFGVDGLVVMIVFLFIGYGFLGLVIPSSAVLSLEDHGEIAGTASALMGSLQMVIGAAIMGFVGIFANGTPRPMLLGIAGCAIAAFIVAQVALRKSVRRSAAHAV